MRQWLKNADVRLSVALVIVTSIGFSGIFLPGIAEIVRLGVSEQWLGFLGNIVGALVTLAAAMVAWLAVQKQISAQSQLADEARARKELAARGVLPLALSGLHEYARRSVEIFDGLIDPIAPGTMLKIPPVPAQDIREIRDALEHMASEPPQQLISTLHFLQIQHARLLGFESSAFDGMATTHEISSRLIEALDLVAFIGRSYSYARGPARPPLPAPDELLNAIFTCGLNDTEPALHAEMTRRAKLNSEKSGSQKPENRWDR